MENYCGEGCRRAHLLNYFGEELRQKEKALSQPCCDWCTNPKVIKEQLNNQRAMGTSTLVSGSISSFTATAKPGKVQSLGRGNGFVKMPGQSADGEDDYGADDDDGGGGGARSVGFTTARELVGRRNVLTPARLDQASNVDEYMATGLDLVCTGVLIDNDCRMLAIAAELEIAESRKATKSKELDFRSQLRKEFDIKSVSSLYDLINFPIQ